MRCSTVLAACCGLAIALSAPRAEAQVRTIYVVVHGGEASPALITALGAELAASGYRALFVRDASHRWLAKARTRRTREVKLELIPPPADSLDPESRAMARQALRALYRALDRLSDPLRVAFVLCELEGMEPMEAARVEGVSAGTMRTRLSRAKDAVRTSLEDDPYVAQLRRSGGTHG